MDSLYIQSSQRLTQSRLKATGGAGGGVKVIEEADGGVEASGEASGRS